MQPANQHDRHGLVGLPHDQRGRRSDLVGEPCLGHLERTAEQIGMPAPVDDRGQPGRAQRDADRTAPPRPPETVADDDRDRHPVRRDQILAQRAGRGVGIDRQQQDALMPVVRADIRMVDPGIGHHEPEAMLGDDQVRPMPHDAFGFRQHELDKPRILAGLFRQLARPRRRHDGRHVDQPAFRLRHDLLRDDDDIAGFEREVRVDQRRDRYRIEVVARLHHRHAVQPDDRDPVGHRLDRVSRTLCAAAGTPARRKA